MLHPLKPPIKQVEDRLLDLIEWQEKLLVFAANHTDANETALRTALGDVFTDWLMEKRYTGLRNSLAELVTCPASDKQAVLQDFEHDQNFWLGDPSFRFAYDMRTDAHKFGRKCLNLFYEIFYAFDKLLQIDEPFKRTNLYEGYLSNNPNLARVCPFCDGSFTRELPKKGKITKVTLEHFFHKAAHPTICLHPHNLFPCCAICNSQRADQEMLWLDEAPLSMGDIFHPILNPARNNIEIRYYSRDIHSPDDLEFVKIYKEDWHKAIGVYSTLYRIPARWKELWTEVESVVQTRLWAAIDNHRDSGNAAPSLVEFDNMIGLIIRSLKRYSNRYEYPAHRWLVWVRSESDRVRKLHQAYVVVGTSSVF
ncbi:MAG: hypothetical protein ACPG8W_08090 [Candidatus Promineifilaceae bacterium]